MGKMKLTKEDWLLIFHILKKSKMDNKKEFVLVNPLTHIYIVGSMIHLGVLYLIKGKNFQL